MTLRQEGKVMPIELILEVLFFCVVTLYVIVYFIRKEMISVSYSLVWIFSVLILMVMTSIPDFMENVANMLGFEVLSNMVFALIIMILMFVAISLTIIVSGQKEKIRLLVQEVSILKSKNNEK